MWWAWGVGGDICRTKTRKKHGTTGNHRKKTRKFVHASMYISRTPLQCPEGPSHTTHRHL